MPESSLTQAVRFSVAGKARPKGRARTSAKNGVRRHYTPQATTEYENAIRAAAIDALGSRPRFNGPVSVTVTVRCKPPQRTSKNAMLEMLAGRLMPTTRPDLDNIMKVVADGISKIVIRDDADIVCFAGAKRYATENGIDVTVEPAPNANPS